MFQTQTTGFDVSQSEYEVVVWHSDHVHIIHIFISYPGFALVGFLTTMDGKSWHANTLTTMMMISMTMI